LRDACAEGRLTHEELADRLEAVFGARTESDLAPLLGDLPVRVKPQERVRYGAWWRRVCAFVFDGFVVGAAGAFAGTLPLAGGWSYPVGLVVLSPVATLAYFTLSHGSRRGQSFGDRALGIAVRNASDGGRATYGQAFGRTFMVMLFSGLWFMGGFVDFLWPLWDRRRQAWHDKVAGTIVVRSL
jgi:uncharacterized RDD family membrane protein YckC